MGVDVGRARILRSATLEPLADGLERIVVGARALTVASPGRPPGWRGFPCSRGSVEADFKRGVRARDQAGPS